MDRSWVGVAVAVAYGIPEEVAALVAWVEEQLFEDDCSHHNLAEEVQEVEGVHALEKPDWGKERVELEDEEDQVVLAVADIPS